MRRNNYSDYLHLSFPDPIEIESKTTDELDNSLNEIQRKVSTGNSNVLSISRETQTDNIMENESISSEDSIEGTDNESTSSEDSDDEEPVISMQSIRNSRLAHLESKSSDQIDKLNIIALDRELHLISQIRDQEETVRQLKDIITRATQAHLQEYQAFKTMPTFNEQKIPMPAAIITNDIPTPVNNTDNRPGLSLTVEKVRPKKIPAIIPTPNKTIRRKKPQLTKKSTRFESDQDQLKRELAAMNAQSLRKRYAELEVKKSKTSEERQLLKYLNEELIQKNQKSEKKK